MNITIIVIDSQKNMSSGRSCCHFLTALFTLTDVALSLGSYITKGAVAFANIHNCNATIDSIKDML